MRAGSRIMAFAFGLGVVAATDWSGGTTIAQITIPLGVPGALAQSPENARDCVLLDLDPQQRGLRYRVSNSCGRSWRCSLSWTLTCGSAEAVRHFPRSVEFVLPGHGARVLDESAVSCNGEEDWDVSAAQWACNPVR